jgi:2-phospho-L-lactate guanylyltransferase
MSPAPMQVRASRATLGERLRLPQGISRHGTSRRFAAMQCFVGRRGRADAGAPVLSPEGRDALCRRFLADTVNLAEQLVARGNIHVVSSDLKVAELAADLGIHCHGDNDHDLNSALTSAAARIVARNQVAGRNMLILPIDLAFNSRAAVAPVLAAHADLVVVPDRLDQGTNLRLPGNVAADFRFQYGDNSFSRHRSEAERHGLTVETQRDPAFCFDVDTPEDYAAWAATAFPARFASRIASLDP